MRFLSATPLLALFCAACGPRQLPNAVAFNADEAAYIHKHGSATIKGEAFVINSSGRAVKAAGQDVWLVPATPYAKQRFTAIYGTKKSVPARAVAQFASDPDYLANTRRAKMGSNGKFSFEDVAPGAYFIVSQMTWKGEDEMSSHGAAMYETVTITGKETEPVNVVVSGSASGA